MEQLKNSNKVEQKNKIIYIIQNINGKYYTVVSINYFYSHNNNDCNLISQT